jgi:hypothetical protein
VSSRRVLNLDIDLAMVVRNGSEAESDLRRPVAVYRQQELGHFKSPRVPSLALLIFGENGSLNGGCDCKPGELTGSGLIRQ